MTKTVGAFLFCVLAMTIGAEAQFSAFRWVDVPEAGSWAEFVRTQTVGQDLTYMNVKLAVVGQQVIGGKEYIWFEISSHIDDLYEIAEDRVPYVARFSIKKEDTKTCEAELIERIEDFVIKLGVRDPVRIPKPLMQQVIDKGYVSGGEKGSGSCIDYAFEEKGTEKIKVEAGSFECSHKRGKGKSVVVTNTAAKRTASVTSELDLWIRNDVPFGIVKLVNKIYGKGPETSNVSLKVETEETYTLKAYGKGAKTAILTEPKPYSTDQVTARADDKAPGKKPAGATGPKSGPGGK